MIQQLNHEPPSLRIAQTFAAGTAHKGAPVRRAFVKRAEGQNSPLEDLMRAARGGAGGGRGGRTRLALLLSLWWVNSVAPYTSDRPASWWAELNGIGGTTKGPRTVTANLQELARRGFITVTPSAPGMPNTVNLLDDLARSGQSYVRPDGMTGSFFRVPEELWTTGTIARLSGPGLAMYLMLLYYYRRPDEIERSAGLRVLTPAAPPVWFSPNSFRENHGLSEDTRLAGIQNLRTAGVIHVDSVPIDTRSPAGHRRFRRQLLTLNPQFVPPLRSQAPSK